MRQISLDDCGQVMPPEYFSDCRGGRGEQVYTVMVIKAPSGQHLAVTFPMKNLNSDKSKDVKPRNILRQRRAIQWFMKRNTEK